MYQSFVILILLIAALHYTIAMDPESLRSLNECGRKYNVDDEILNNIKEWRKMSDDPNAKCMAACWLEGMNLLKDGQPNIEAMYAWNEKYYKSKEAKRRGSDGSDYCTQTSRSTERCELGYELVTCYVKFVRENNLKREFLQ